MASDAAMLRALGKRVRDLRHGRGFSQERLAELAEIHENHVRRIEAGTANPSYLVVGRLARALGVNPSALF
ncbi:MAG TPA: helix-turn-helix transcriptional regulator [Thermoanaerobaculia bacterium]|jgi:transcriptional regulator with XRE-family HTH domain|nr:helix-turn-helix transcriptional regulator [Thermoanaerobaculia bacterium]